MTSQVIRSDSLPVSEHWESSRGRPESFRREPDGGASDWPWGFIFIIGSLWFPPPVQASQRQRLSVLPAVPTGVAWPSNDCSRGSRYAGLLFYIAVAVSNRLGKLSAGVQNEKLYSESFPKISGQVFWGGAVVEPRPRTGATDDDGTGTMP